MLLKGNILWLYVPLLATLRARGALFTAPEDLPQKQYDFVVVGGKLPVLFNAFITIVTMWLFRIAAGAAGNVIANRLTENPNFSVLVIEAGIT